MLTDERLSSMQEDLRSGRVPLARAQLADDQVPRLRAIVRPDGPIEYRFWKDGTPFTLPASSVAEARQLALAIINK